VLLVAQHSGSLHGMLRMASLTKFRNMLAFGESAAGISTRR
jgi:hypothetical protein